MTAARQHVPAADAPWIGAEVTSLLDSVASLAGTRRVEPLPGGLTNHNYKVTTPRGTYVARLSSGDTALLAIDRDAEYRNSVIAAASGAGPEVVDYLPGRGVLVITWLTGRALTDTDLGDTAVLARVVEACRRLHSGARFGNDFDMFAIQAGYLDLVQRRGFRLPERYLDFMPLVAEIHEALTDRPTRTVPCHNDLLASNLLDDGEQVWLIDYEYAGNNDPCFELGNIWSEADLPLDQLDAVVELYFGHASAALVGRARLHGLMSKYGWTLWASIQDAVSDIDFDFWSWGMEKYERAVAEFDGPDLTRLLADVRQESSREQQ